MKQLLALCLSVVISATLFAQHSHDHFSGPTNCTSSPIPLDVLQPDGKTVSVVSKGNMSHYWTETVDGYTVVTINGAFEYATKVGNNLVSTGVLAHNPQDRIAGELALVSAISKSLQPAIRNLKNTPLNYAPNGSKTYPTTGNIRVLALLIDFPDLPSQYTVADMQSLLTNPNHRSGDGSFKSFYTDASFNQLTITVDVMGWYTAVNNYAYYSDSAGTARAAKLVREAVDAAEVAGANFANYDNDNDGDVDGILVVHSGPGAETGIPNRNRHIWSHRWVMNGGSSVPGGGSVTYDGKFINDYMINPETRGTLTNPRLVGIGVFCHEFGHNLGLPDLYDTDNTNGDSEGIGNWGVMAGGTWLGGEHRPGGFCAWSKEDLGWISPTTLSASATGTYSLQPAGNNQNDILKITTSDPTEYFLLENRQKIGRDLELPGHGLAIWHINTTKTNSFGNRVNGDENLKGVDLEEADGLNGLDIETNRGDGGDVFPGTTNKTDFNNITNPNSQLYNNSNSGLIVRNITERGDSIILTLGAAAATCSGLTTLTTATGSFDDGSGMTANYDDNQNCTWLIQPTAGATSITLNFNSFSTEASNDEVKVYDGNSSAATLLGTFSGLNQTIPAITSTGGALFIEFTTNNSITEAGWDVSYTSVAPPAATCSGLTTLTAASGTFEDGSSINDYTNNLSCTWLIQPTGASSITLNFSAFNTATNDVVNVYDGPSATSTLIGTYSGLNQFIPTINSTGGSLFIEFITNSSITEAGWDANYTSTSPPTATCSGTTTLTSSTGVFDDGSATANYTDNLSCRWLIQPAAASSITLSFSAFDTEATNDVVSIYDGSATSATLLGTFSGNSIPSSVTSSGGAMLVEFSTNGSVTSGGWNANYSSTVASTPPTCSGLTTLTTPTGFFDDGSGPSANYGDNSSCTWLIQPTGATSISLTFPLFFTEATNDIVNVYDGASSAATLIGTFSGTTAPPTVNSTGGSLFIEFITNGSIVNSGWDAFYSSSGGTPTCSGLTTLTTPTGSFTDGSGINNYTNNLSCTWLIQPAGATNINANFTALATENNNDVINVYNGTSNTAPLIGTFSGSTIPAGFSANSGAMFIEFITNISVVSQGWTINYSSTTPPPTPCTGTTTLTANSGAFSDGSGTSNYLDGTNCSWLIQPTNGQNVVLDFTTFDTENNFDFVTVYDGTSSASPQLGRFSGTSIPPTITSSGSALFVQFTSDGSITRQGWDATYSTTPGGSSGCSGLTTLTAPTGIVTDGSGTGSYGNNSNCTWLIQPTGATSVTATFNALSTQLFADQVRLFDGNNSSGVLLGVFSGNTIPAGSYTANTGSMFIEFTTNPSIVGLGWEIAYTSQISSPPFCSGLTNLTANNGSFSDGSGASNYLDNSNCEWLIQPSNGLPVTLNFTAFDTEQGFDQVRIYDGTSSTAPLLAANSGSTIPAAVTSSGGALFVTFTSDVSANAAGWDATYTTSSGSSSCAGLTTLTTPTGVVTDGSSPPANYTNNLACEWLIQPVGATSVSATFLSLNTELNSDQVILYDGTNNNGTVLGTFSGLTPPTTSITANSGSLFIEFITDGAVTDIGWAIAWTATTPPPSGPCSGLTNLTANNGAFSDGSGTNNYADNSNCEWLIQPANNQPITLNFTAFDVEQGFDQVSVYDGPSATATLLGSYSGNTLPPSLTSTGGDMFVTFTSDPSVNFTGWDANYTTSTSTPTITMSPDTLFLAATAGATGAFSITTSSSWTITDNATWLVTAIANGTGNATSGALALSANTGADRIGKVWCRGPGGIYDSLIVIQAGQASPTLSVNPRNVTLNAAANSNANVTVTSNGFWNTTASTAWLTATPATGNGNGTTVIEAITSNTGADRTGFMLFEDLTGTITDTVFVTQSAAGPFIDLDNGPVNLAFTNGSNAAINLRSNVSWTISNTAAWLSITPNAGTNNGTLTATALSDNTSGNNRSAWIYASDGNQTIDSVEIIQLNGTLPNLSLSKSVITLSPNNGSTDDFDVVSNVNWSFGGIPAWLSLTPINGSNNSNVTVTANSANNSGSTRTATITALSPNPGVTQRTIVINQLDGSSPYLGTSVDTVILARFQGSTNSFDVISNVSWTAQEGLNWLLLGPSSGTNDATITLQASSANLSTSSRGGDVLISSAGLPAKIVHVIQEPTTPNLGVSQTNLFIAGGANSAGNFSVLGNTSNWVISNNSSWLTITPNTGSFTQQISVTANSDNTGAPRRDTLTISATGVASRTVIVTQDSMSTIGINEVTLADNINVFPNPTLSVVNVTIDERLSINDYQVYVTNILGSRINVNQTLIGSNRLQLDLTGNVSGIYFLTIDNGTDRIVKKISLIESF